MTTDHTNAAGGVPSVPGDEGKEDMGRTVAVEAPAIAAQNAANIDFSAFVLESNRIEGILRRPTRVELAAHQRFMCLERMSVQALEDFVSAIAPGHFLRRAEGVNVRVGRYIAPPGGYGIQVMLAGLVTRATDNDDPYRVHCDYEQLHPFTDGNGRSGRVLWLWMMARQHGLRAAFSLGFLHRFYYQTLDALPPHVRSEATITEASQGNGTPHNPTAALNPKDPK